MFSTHIPAGELDSVPRLSGLVAVVDRRASIPGSSTGFVSFQTGTQRRGVVPVLVVLTMSGGAPAEGEAAGPPPAGRRAWPHRCGHAACTTGRLADCRPRGRAHTARARAVRVVVPDFTIGWLIYRSERLPASIVQGTTRRDVAGGCIRGSRPPRWTRPGGCGNWSRGLTTRAGG